jgi:hypothetical protein
MDTNTDTRRLPALDAWRGLGVLMLFHLVFFGQHMEQAASWALGADAWARTAGRMVSVLFSSGVLGLDVLFMVAGFLAVRSMGRGASPLALAIGRHARLLPFVAVSGAPFVAFGGLTLGAYFKSLVLLVPANVPGSLERAFAHANAFLLFSLACALVAAVSRGRGVAACVLAAIVAVLAASGPEWVPVNGHFLAFFWGMGAAWAAGRLPSGSGLRGLAGALLTVAAVFLCRKLSDARGEDLYFLLDGRDWRTLALLAPLQALLACALALTAQDLKVPGRWRAAWPLEILGRASNCFFMVFVLWSFTLTRAYAREFASPAASLAYLYALTLSLSVAVALVLAPFLEGRGFSGKTARSQSTRVSRP